MRTEKNDLLKLSGDLNNSSAREVHGKSRQRVGIRETLIKAFPASGFLRTFCIAAITTAFIALAVLSIYGIRKNSNLQDDGGTPSVDSMQGNNLDASDNTYKKADTDLRADDGFVLTSHNEPVNSITNNDSDEVQDAAPDVPESVKRMDKNQQEISVNEVKESVYNELLSEKIWENFVFNSGYLRITDSGAERLSFVFTSDKEGTNGEVRVSITQTADTDFYAERLVNADEVEKYDICNYDIPYSQSIPEHLKFTLKEPIFQYEDLCEEIILYRATKIQESNEKYYNIRFAIEIDGYVVDYTFKIETLNDIYQILT